MSNRIESKEISQQKYEDFSQAVDKMVEALEEFGNVGTGINTTIQTSLDEISRYQNLLTSETSVILREK